jgi:predicted  nucleic acid-binding Zn-ribbon protein
MSLPAEKERWEVELRQLREELHELRAEQRELAKAVDQLVKTFTSISTHLGITSEPYSRKERRHQDVPGFA